MLFTVVSVLLSVYDRYVKNNKMRRYLGLIQKHLHSASLVFRRRHGRGAMDQSLRLSRTRYSPLVEESRAVWSEMRLMEDNDMQMAALQPQLKVDLRYWTSYLESQSLPLGSLKDTHLCHVLLQVNPPDDSQAFLTKSLAIPPDKRVKVTDCAMPVAWKSGSPFGIVLVCPPEKLAKLGIAFSEDTLVLDEMLELQELITIRLEGHPHSLLRSSSQPESPIADSSDFSETSSSAAGPSQLPSSSSWANILENMHRSVIKEEDESEPPSFLDDESNESLASLGDGASRPKFLGATPVKSSRFAAEITDSECSSLTGGDCAAGEAPSESLEILAPEALTPARRSRSNRNKPPNVLLYCGKKDSVRQSEVIKSIMQQCINPDRYVLYPLKHEDVLTTPWADSSLLLIIASEKLNDRVDAAFLQYFQQGGLVLSFSSAFDTLFVDRAQTNRSVGILSLNYKRWQDVSLIGGRQVYQNCDTTLSDVSIRVLATDKLLEKPVLLEANHDLTGGVALLSQVNLDKNPADMAISPDIFALLKKSNQARFEILRDLLDQLGLDTTPGSQPPLTPCFLLATTETKKASLLTSISSRLKDGVLKAQELSLHFIDDAHHVPGPAATDTLLVVKGSTTVTDFNMAAYKENLQTKVLGNVVFYAEVVNTTMNFFEGLQFSVPSDVGMVAVASRQLAGQGRGGNTWLSPKGCAMFTLHARVDLSTELGQSVAYLQHITSLAVVEAVRARPGYESIDLRIKWPNDIYFSNTMKLGGVIVKSSIMHNIVHANIGCGFNVSNTDPTICINDLVTQHNRNHPGANLAAFSMEQLIASTISKLEQLIELFQTHGKEAFLQRYYEAWLHSDKKVRVQLEDGTELDGTIVGLDSYGYLSVCTPDGATISVHPDGNSYDMMRNLVAPKLRS